MPHCRRFLGVNSVTNIEPGGGVLPVPIIRNEDWFEKFSFFIQRSVAVFAITCWYQAKKAVESV